MEFFTVLSLSVAAIVFLVVAISKVLYDKFISQKAFDAKGSIQVLLTSLFFSLIGFITTKTLETYNNTLKIEKVNTSILQTSQYSSTLEKLLSLDRNSVFRKYLEVENLLLIEKFKQINNYEILLKREEVIPCWEFLIENSNKHVYATNVVSLDDWKTFSPSSGEDAHKKALGNNIEIRRIFIYSGDDEVAKEVLRQFAQTQMKWGNSIKVKLLSRKWFEESPYVSAYLRDLGTQDIVIYDNECVLLTNTDDKRKIISSTLTNNAHRLKTAITLFERLWNESEETNRTDK